ncbi:MAG: saccharopine dehydrogenase NADP-binding domain-containing protein [Burkholderiaceae bacterium]|nr:saccharopine dehydrogenase NADP-binding domain-containing protein [Burkholderiaceae bacterium]
MAQRPYRLILFGAIGFVGRLAAAYLAQRREPLAWAIAGRDAARLDALRRQLADTPNPPGVVVADSLDAAAVDAMAAATQVLISTAGPFARYGDLVVAACVRQRTHYADITGETVWVRGLIDRHHAQAARDGTRIVPFCGFDSIPSDLGAFLVARQIQHAFGVPCDEVTTYFRMFGGFNGGTLASNFERHARGDAARGRDPFLLDPEPHRSFEEIEANRDPAGPRFDVQIDAWVAPFIMGPINTRVVRRSAALFAAWGEPYGPHFRYQEYTRFSGPLTGAKATALSGAAALFDAGVHFAPTRALLERLLPQPGTGPAERLMQRGWFEAVLIGRAADGRTMRAQIAFRGDPGNRATLRLLCESGLLLAGDPAGLPGGTARGGVLTPATAFGEALVPPLRAAGFRIEVGG